MLKLLSTSVLIMRRRERKFTCLLNGRRHSVCECQTIDEALDVLSLNPGADAVMLIFVRLETVERVKVL